jgi:hypothetical protein
MRQEELIQQIRRLARQQQIAQHHHHDDVDDDSHTNSTTTKVPMKRNQSKCTVVTPEHHEESSSNQGSCNNNNEIPDQTNRNNNPTAKRRLLWCQNLQDHSYHNDDRARDKPTDINPIIRPSERRRQSQSRNHTSHHNDVNNCRPQTVLPLLLPRSVAATGVLRVSSSSDLLKSSDKLLLESQNCKTGIHHRGDDGTRKATIIHDYPPTKINQTTVSLLSEEDVGHDMPVVDSGKVTAAASSSSVGVPPTVSTHLMLVNNSGIIRRSIREPINELLQNSQDKLLKQQQKQSRQPDLRESRSSRIEKWDIDKNNKQPCSVQSSSPEALLRTQEESSSSKLPPPPRRRKRNHPLFCPTNNQTRATSEFESSSSSSSSSSLLTQKSHQVHPWTTTTSANVNMSSSSSSFYTTVRCDWKSKRERIPKEPSLS